MEPEFLSFENFSKLRTLCTGLIRDSKNIDSLQELREVIAESRDSFVKVIQPTVLATFYPILRDISKDKSSFSDKEKQLVTEIFGELFSRSSIDKLGLFLNIYAFLVQEILDTVNHCVLPISEEYKLKILDCSRVLVKAISSDLIFELYTKEHVLKLSPMLYVAIEVAKNERMRDLKISAIRCIMAIARVLEDDEFQDVVVRAQVADMFLFVLPGIASGLKHVAMEDEKIGHKVPVEALKAWGRIVVLLMQDYKSEENKPDKINLLPIQVNELNTSNKMKRWKNSSEVREYFNNNKLTPEWYKDTDTKLQRLVTDFVKLTHHSHFKVRTELAQMCEVIINSCLMTMPRSSSYLIDILIIMTEDENKEISNYCRNVLKTLSDKFTSDNLQKLLEFLQEGFFKRISQLPRQFNTIDVREQLSALNLIIGYLSLFGKHKLNHVLLTGNHLEKLLNTLIYMSELEKGSKSGLFEEFSNKDFDENLPNATWKNFRHFRDDSVTTQLEKLCKLLGNPETFHLVTDFLLDIFLYEPEHRKEATLILNEVVSGCDYSKEIHKFIDNILNTYTDSTYLQIPLSVEVDEFGREPTLAEVKDNVLQVCLLLEGIGKISLALGNEFKAYLFKTMYLVLEKAGCNHGIVRKAALIALKDASIACRYLSIADMLNNNIDYFAFHIERKLNRSHNKEGTLNVFSVIIRHSSLDMLHYIADILKEVLVQSCDRFKEHYVNDYLRVFRTFFQCLWSWLNIEIKVEPIKSKAQKAKEMEDFCVTGIKAENNDFSDEIMGKSAQQMYEEDLKKSREELKKETEEPEVEEYKKPDLPIHISLTIDILSRSLNFLPSKDRTRKLLVLEVLSLGLEVIRDYEDELLPLVHHIWSPLTPRFRESDQPLIVNYSFKLLGTLARLSKEFIRGRTEKEVLPSILQIMDALSKESYLKDKGSAYRYSQNYKLQVEVLENLGNILAYLDVQDKTLIKTSEGLFKYLSDKQPVSLQVGALKFFKQILAYDPDLLKINLDKWKNDRIQEEFTKNLTQIQSFIESCHNL